MDVVPQVADLMGKELLSPVSILVLMDVVPQEGCNGDSQRSRNKFQSLF